MKFIKQLFCIYNILCGFPSGTSLYLLNSSDVQPIAKENNILLWDNINMVSSRMISLWVWANCMITKQKSGIYYRNA